jgi:hypothetical protein
MKSFHLQQHAYLLQVFPFGKMMFDEIGKLAKLPFRHQIVMKLSFPWA